MHKCRFVAIDLETTGLDIDTCQILQIGAVAFDVVGGKEYFADTFDRTIRHQSVTGEPFALAMNASLLRSIADGGGSWITETIFELHKFIRASCIDNPHPVGFNVAAFDIAFLKRWGFSGATIHHRPIELGSVFVNEDGTPGTSNDIVDRLLFRSVAHRALQDAQDAAELYTGRLLGKW